MKSESKFLAPTWHEIEEALLDIAEKIVSSNAKVDAIVGIMRGGWIAARVLADLLNVKHIGAIEIKFYRGVQERRERPVILQPLLVDVRDKNVLVVDDVADTGKSIQVAVNAVSLYGPRVIRTATIYIKPWTVVKPDFFYGTTEKWIIFPWEPREVIEEILRAEYKVLPRTKEEIESITVELSKRTGMRRELISRILDLILKGW